MAVSPRMRAGLLLLIALVLVLTGARLATSTAAPSTPTHRDDGGALLDFGPRDGRGVLPWSGDDMAKAPGSFRTFVRSELDRIWRTELGHKAGCKTSPRITVDTLRTDGFAMGDVFSKPLKSCPDAGGGYVAIWAVRKGQWKQVIGTQEAVACQRLEKFDIPAELGIDQCYEGNDLVPYTHP